jgi:hypothetical protein
MYIMKLLLTILLALGLSVSALAQTFDPTQPRCAPATEADIRSGTVGNDLWFYWWCRDTTQVWLTWNGFLSSELKNYVFVGAVEITSQIRRGDTVGSAAAGTLRAKPWNALLVWGLPSDRPEMAHLKAAVLAAAGAETTTRPLPGTPFAAPLSLGDLWNVTPNGASPTRRTNLVVNGLVTSTYGQTVKILTPCDCTTLKFPEGSMTQKCPLASAAIDLTAVTEVISCIRLPR